MPVLSAAADKRRVAFQSVAGAVFITALKLFMGLATGSLGILSEAAHSGIDLVAAGITYLAVRVSDKPADADHTYGHQKVENFSAFLEIGLLLATCAWIAQHRNLFLIGPTGIGKSWLAEAFAERACRSGYSAYCARAARLFHDLHVARGDGSYNSAGVCIPNASCGRCSLYSPRKRSKARCCIRRLAAAGEAVSCFSVR